MADDAAGTAEPNEDGDTVAVGAESDGNSDTRPVRPRLPRAFTLDHIQPRDLNQQQLRALVDRTPVLHARASEQHDGRRIPVVLVQVLDTSRRTRGGIEVHLLTAEGGEIVDRTRTDGAGMALLRFAAPGHAHGVGSANGGSSDGGDASAADGFVAVPGTDVGRAVSVPAGAQHATVNLQIAQLPDLEGTTVVDAETGMARVVTSPPTGDDLLERLPADFTPELCEAVTRNVPWTPDPIFKLVPGVNPEDFRTKRYPIVRRLSVARLGAPRVDGSIIAAAAVPSPPARYLVRLRQEWRFLTYTLGELQVVDNLDPGTVLHETMETAERTSELVEREARDLVALATSQVQSLLNQLQSVNHLIDTTTKSVTQAVTQAVPNPAFNSGIGVGVSGSPGSSGFSGAVAGAAIGGAVGGPLGAVAGGLMGFFAGGGSASAKVSLPTVGIPATIAGPTTSDLLSTLKTVDDLDASLTVNQLVNTAVSQTNHAIRDAMQTLKALESIAGRVTDRVSPLLSRVTNLLRWTVYQNYMVCTHVEDVLLIQELRVTRPGDWPDEDLFPDEDVVEYRPFFEPVLLRPELRPQFAVLAQEVDRRQALVSSLVVEVELGMPSVPSMFLGSSGRVGELVVSASRGGTQTVPLMPGQRVVTFELPLEPRRPGDPVELQLDLDISPMAAVLSNPLFGQLLNVELTVERVRLWFGTSPGTPPDFDQSLAGTLSVRLEQPQARISRQYQVPARARPASSNPLTRHVNRNRSYYLGVLIQAALALPSLRDDAPQLRDIDSEDPIWRMPIVGVEGDRIFVLTDPPADDAEVERIMDDAGAATLVQVATPGAYAEALQGLLALDDAVGRIHPALEPLPAPVAPIIA